ncbi:MAG: nucleotidyltransferase family protein [Candidatus Micrarchaeota archaeon]|nr:nucleotidyltransferase family protein [Candidatus Micrarchaeota archaeon]MDE1857290.1 nucleotidyltransferase family protein [Candidatus Micrarchaeota archaeon]
MKAVILAGGYGKRLRPLTEERPKPLVEVGGKPIIEWQVNWLKSMGVDSFIVLAGYLKERVIDHLGAGRKWGVKMAYLIEEEPLGTGGALKNAEHLLENEKRFVMVNGDIITNIDFKDVKNDSTVATMALVPLKSPFGVIKTSNSHITQFVEKPVLEDYWINAGIYVMKSEIFSMLPEKGDIEKFTFPKLAKENQLGCAKYTDSYWRSVDSMKDLEEVSNDLKEHKVYRGF